MATETVDLHDGVALSDVDAGALIGSGSRTESGLVDVGGGVGGAEVTGEKGKNEASSAE